MKITKAVIPAAGYGTRLMPLSAVIPKEMLPVRLKPMIQYAVEEAVQAGLGEIIFVIRKGKQMIKDYFSSIDPGENNSELVKSLKFLKQNCRFFYVEQPIPIGLGDAIYQAKKLVKDEIFCVLLPDNVFLEGESRILRMIKRYEGLSGNMVGVEKRMIGNEPEGGNEAIFDYTEIDESLVRVDKIYDKGYVRLINPMGKDYELRGIGRYILTPEFFEYVDKVRKTRSYKELDDIQPLQLLATEGKLYGYIVEQKRFDVGYPAGYKLAHQNWY